MAIRYSRSLRRICWDFLIVRVVWYISSRDLRLSWRNAIEMQIQWGYKCSSSAVCACVWLYSLTIRSIDTRLHSSAKARTTWRFCTFSGLTPMNQTVLLPSYKMLINLMWLFIYLFAFTFWERDIIYKILCSPFMRKR